MFVILRQSPRTFVDKLAFVTSAGHADGGNWRNDAGLPGKGPTAVITDIGILRPQPESRELVMTDLHPGFSMADAEAATGWPLQRAATCVESPPPNVEELGALRDLIDRTARAHAHG